MSIYNAQNPLPGYEIVTSGVIEDGWIYWSNGWVQVSSDLSGIRISDALFGYIFARPIDRTAEDAVIMETPTADLTFSQALEAMKQGKVITRAGWEWRYKDKRLGVRMVGDKSWGRVTSINGLHILATDWRIVEVSG